jgi:hypothetical protein
MIRPQSWSKSKDPLQWLAHSLGPKVGSSTVARPQSMIIYSGSPTVYDPLQWIAHSPGQK